MIVAIFITEDDAGQNVVDGVYGPYPDEATARENLEGDADGAVYREIKPPFES